MNKKTAGSEESASNESTGTAEQAKQTPAAEDDNNLDKTATETSSHKESARGDGRVNQHYSIAHGICFNVLLGKDARGHPLPRNVQISSAMLRMPAAFTSYANAMGSSDRIAQLGRCRCIFVNFKF